MVEDAGVSPAKDGSCSNMSMFKAWPCRHVGLETAKVRRVVLGLDASSTQHLGIDYINVEDVVVPSGWHSRWFNLPRYSHTRRLPVAVLPTFLSSCLQTLSMHQLRPDLRRQHLVVVCGRCIVVC